MFILVDVDKEGSIEYYFSNNNFEIQDHIWIEQLLYIYIYIYTHIYIFIYIKTLLFSQT